MSTLSRGNRRIRLRNIIASVAAIMLLATSFALAPIATAQQDGDDPEVQGQYLLRNLEFQRYLTAGEDTVRTGVEANPFSTWTLVANDNGTYRLANEATGRYLDADSVNQNYDVDLSGPRTTRGLDWRIEEADGGVYLRNTSFNRLLDADPGFLDWNVDTGPNGQDDNIWELIPAPTAASNGAVYVGNNGLEGNSVAAFARDDAGNLEHIGDFATDGLGSTEFDGGEGLDPLISADSLVVTEDEGHLLVVNAGSDSITVFEIQDDFSLEITSVVDSGGVGPNSIAVDNGRVFVTNIHNQDGERAEPTDTGNVVGFNLSADGVLEATGAVLDFDNRPANIDFSLDGTQLVVSAITSGSAALTGANADASIYLIDINGGSLSIADTGTSVEDGNANASVVSISVENLQGASTDLLDTGFFAGDVDPETGRFPTDTGFFFTEPWVGLHNGQFDLFDAGELAGAGIAQLAEGGNADIIFEDFDAAVGGGAADFDGFAQNEQGLQFISPGQTANAQFEIRNAAAYRYFSYASMVIPSNDSFFANDDPTGLAIFDEEGNFLGDENGEITFTVTADAVYDAGSELNDGRGAAGFSLGIAGTPEASNSGESTDTFEAREEVVTAATLGDEFPGLNAFQDFNTAARATIADGLEAGEEIARFTISIEEVPGRNQASAIDFDIQDIGGNEFVVVTEAREFDADGSAPRFPFLQAGSVSVYQIVDGQLELREGDFAFTNDAADASELNTYGEGSQQLTACWIDFGHGDNADIFFVSNAISASISSLRLNADGTVTELDRIAAQGDSAFPNPGEVLTPPEHFGLTDGFIDLDVSPDGENLYQLAGLSGEIYVYSVGVDGELSEQQVVTGLPEVDTQGLISVGGR